MALGLRPCVITIIIAQTSLSRTPSESSISSRKCLYDCLLRAMTAFLTAKARARYKGRLCVRVTGEGVVDVPVYCHSNVFIVAWFVQAGGTTFS